ncbi:luciferase [Microbacterium sp. CH12i]|uniref:LLM class flavin-dependent oxidoreductase n=1 Tax=Microbacterium sp. CH12i TaxID=1479651 RepID=UPI00046179F5|nr:LLM class flavin-dependent oxidoreductase [Microbacterium sp. CH12i]KDA06727.1 luciferase [Microbacterium sp. CH12i]
MSKLEIYSYLTPTTFGQSLDEIQAGSAAISGLDRALIGYHSFGPDNIVLAALVLAANPELNVLIAHRPGVIEPPVAARMISTLSRVSDGRVDLHVLAGGAPGDQLREGDYVAHDDRYRRATEYVEALQQIWAAEAPTSHSGEFYKFEDTRPNEMKPEEVRIHMGGASGAGLEFGAAKADVYMLWGEPLEEVRARIEEISAKASGYGRPTPRISLSLRLYLGETEEEAWSLARSEPAYQKFIERGAEVSTRAHAEDAGRNRQLKVAQQGEVHDDCLWTGLVAAMNGLGNASALVGTEDRVMESLRAYRKLGVDTFLISGKGGDWDQSLAPLATGCAVSWHD